MPSISTHPLASFQPLPAPEIPSLTGCPPAGRDEASSLEVTWPDGRIMARAVARSETNSVLEVPYPLDVEDPILPAPLEVRAKSGCGVGGFGGRNEGLGSAGSGCPGLIPPHLGGFRFSPNAVRAGILPARERTLYR